MVFKGSGKVRGFRISSKIVLLAFLCLLVYLMASGAIIWDYFKGRRLNSEYVKELDGLRDKTREMKNALFRAREDIKMLEEQVSKLDRKGAKKNPPRVSSAKEPDQKKIPEKQPLALKNEKKEQAPKQGEETYEPQVEVRDLRFQRADEKLLVNFNLVNGQKDKAPLRGYVHILANFGHSASPRIMAYPESTLKDGMPAWYKAGYLFKISRFMVIKGEFKLAPDKELPSTVKVVVYAGNGKLIFEKEYKVQPVS
ncbi:hypothetical protein ACFL2O_07385 [Thermodesulfobacteriota bacterium]